MFTISVDKPTGVLTIKHIGFKSYLFYIYPFRIFHSAIFEMFSHRYVLFSSLGYFMDNDLAFKAVFKFFDSIFPTTAALRSDIVLCSKVARYPKRTILAGIGQVHKKIYFILEGAVRTFYRDRNENDVTSWLLFEGDLAISVYSFYNQSPSFEAMETLEDTLVVVLSYENLMRLYREHPAFNYIGRTLTEAYYIKSEDKANALRMLSAQERYGQLLELYPQILRRVPLGYIASYLGITQSTLSRIRNKR